MQQLTGLGQDIDLWCPACSGRGSRRALGCEATEGAANLTLLRFLAIGTICLPYVPWRRASSAHFSLEALNLARYFGANDFGFGAANEEAETVLSLKRLDLVRAAVSRKN